MDYLSAEEVRAFIAAADEAGTRNALVCRLLVQTGMRREELVALTVRDVNTRTGAINLDKVVMQAAKLNVLETHGGRKRKGINPRSGRPFSDRPAFNPEREIKILLTTPDRKRLTGEKGIGSPEEIAKLFPGGELVRAGLKAKHPGRVVPLADRQTLYLLEEWTKGRPQDEFIFLSQKQGRMNLSAINRLVTGLMVKSGVERRKAHPHNLRHTFAIFYLKRTKDVTKLQRVLGHTDIKTTTIYLRYAYEDLLQAAKDAGDLFS